jgi:hypothetical protein
MTEQLEAARRAISTLAFHAEQTGQPACLEAAIEALTQAGLPTHNPGSILRRLGFEAMDGTIVRSGASAPRLSKADRSRMLREIGAFLTQEPTPYHTAALLRIMLDAQTDDGPIPVRLVREPECQRLRVRLVDRGLEWVLRCGSMDRSAVLRLLLGAMEVTPGRRIIQTCKVCGKKSADIIQLCGPVCDTIRGPSPACYQQPVLEPAPRRSRKKKRGRPDPDPTPDPTPDDIIWVDTVIAQGGGTFVPQASSVFRFRL